MRFARAQILALAAVLVSSLVLGAATLSPVSAQTVISVTGPSDGNQSITGAGGTDLASSWTQTLSYTDVSISALLGDFSGTTTTGTAYLTTGLGPTADILDTSDFTFSEGSLTDTSLFSGLTLEGGETYYLVIDPVVGLGGAEWGSDSTATITTGPGVTDNGDYSTSDGAAIAPQSNFTSEGEEGLEYTVSGTVVPECSSLQALSLLPLLGLFWLIFKARRSKEAQSRT